VQSECEHGISAIAAAVDLPHPHAMPAADCTSILKALADRTRMWLVKALLDAEDESVNDLSERLGVSQYNVSKHLRVLKHMGIVDVRFVAQRREYFFAQPFRKRLQKHGPVLDFGCCSFDFSKLPD
jgi:DNA-binding transcriptional ArsR family regulator